MEERIKQAMLKVLLAEESEIVPEANLREDLGMDSLDCIEIIMELEREFNIVISDDDAEKCVTFKDICDLVEELIKK